MQVYKYQNQNLKMQKKKRLRKAEKLQKNLADTKAIYKVKSFLFTLLEQMTANVYRNRW